MLRRPRDRPARPSPTAGPRGRGRRGRGRPRFPPAPLRLRSHLCGGGQLDLHSAGQRRGRGNGGAELWWLGRHRLSSRSAAVWGRGRPEPGRASGDRRAPPRLGAATQRCPRRRLLSRRRRRCWERGPPPAPGPGGGIFCQESARRSGPPRPCLSAGAAALRSPGVWFPLLFVFCLTSPSQSTAASRGQSATLIDTFLDSFWLCPPHVLS